MLNHEGRPDESQDQGNATGNQASGERLPNQLQRNDEETETAGEENPADAGQNQVSPQGRRGWRIVRWWTNPFRSRGNFAEHMTVTVSIVIAFIAFLQYGVYRQQKRIMESSSGQTDQLIEAAEVQARASRRIALAARTQSRAASSFSESAVDIRDNTDRAVSELKRAADDSEKATRRASEAAQKALQASIDLAAQDRRPWVGVQVDCSTCQQFEANGDLKVTIEGIIANSGRTPAVGMKFATAISGPLKGGGVPNMDSLQREFDDQLRENISHMRPEIATEVSEAVKKEITKLQPIVVLGPNAVRRFGIGPNVYTGRKPKPDQDFRSQQSIYAVGKISYFGTDRRTEYVTTFCLVNEPMRYDFNFCPTGNDMK